MGAIPGSREPSSISVDLGPSGFDPERRLEFRPDSRGEFDELVARFVDGGVFIETMSDQGVYIDFIWNDGLHCQLWISVSGRSKLRYYHEDDQSNPPRFDAWGNLNALAAAASGGDVQQAPGEAPQSGLSASEGNAQNTSEVSGD